MWRSGLCPQQDMLCVQQNPKLVRTWGDVSISPASTISTQFNRFTTKDMGTLQSSKNCSKIGGMRPKSPFRERIQANSYPHND